MKKVWFMFAMLVCVLASCSGGGEDDPITPTPNPEVIKSEITIDSSIIANGLSFTHEKGEQSISFSTNENWTLSVASTTSGTTWCTASSTSGTKGTANVKFTVTENTDYDNRSVSVTIKSGTASKTFTVSQKCADALLVTTDKYEVSQEGGTIDIEVKANIEYKMEISEEAKDWITESSGRGLTPYKHTLNISMNEEKEKRQGKVYFKSGDKEETVTIYQAGGAILLLLQDECHVSDKGSTISVNVQSNIEFGVQMPDVDWIVDEASSRGLSSHTLKYVIKANEGYDSRSASIIFFDKNSSLKDTLQVIQAQKDAIVVAKNEYIVESVAGDLKFEVNTNVDFEVSSSVDWIKQNSESRGLEAKPLSFAIEENTSEEDREGLIVMSSGELKQEIKVIQKVKPFFSLSETEFNISSVGDEFEVEVTTNGEYSITMPEADWLTENKSRATSAYTHTFTVAANDTYDARESEIVFTFKDTGEIVKVKVVQAQKDAIIISEKSIKVDDYGGTIEVKLNTNVDFEVQIPSDITWVTKVDSRALTEKSFYLKIAYNPNDEARSANILVINKNSQLSETIVITQQGQIVVATLEEAGTLKSVLGSDYLDIEYLKIVGPINGDDIYCLRKMLGADSFSEADWGNLTTLDLSEVLIVKGGRSYYSKYYTSKNAIGDYMFEGCRNLQKIVLPSSVTSIRDYAFSSCYALISVEIPESIKTIDNYAFSRCNALTSIDIPNSVTSMGNGVFFACSSLNSVTLPDGITSIGDSSFSSCDVLITVDIPNSVTSIGNRAFYGCDYITSIDIPNSVNSIGNEVFRACSNLNKVTIGNSIKSIGERAFSYCWALKTVYCYATTPPTCGNYAFEDPSMTGATLYVPLRCGTKYKISRDWEYYFKNIKEME